MKFLENAKFDVVNSALSSSFWPEYDEVGGSAVGSYSTVDGRLESYSCKMTGSDKKLFRTIMNELDGGSGPNDLHALSPPDSILARSPTRQVSEIMRRESTGSDDGMTASGRFMCDTISTKILFYLISTLNASFSEYDFSDAKSEEFSKESSVKFVMSTIDGQLSPVIGNYEDSIRQQMWSAVDEEIGLSENELVVYSYNPDLSSDPFGESGQIWGFNYFFYNRKRKRIVFFSCRCSAHDDMDEEMGSTPHHEHTTTDYLDSHDILLTPVLGEVVP